MAKQMKQVVSQYDVEGLPQRVIIQWVDDVTGAEDQVIINRDDMPSPDSNIFDNYKNMVEQHML
jgi:hypothetical protein